MLFSFLVVLFLSLSVTATQRLPPENVAVSRKVFNGPALRVTWDPPDTTKTIDDYQIQYGMVRVGEGPAWRTPMSVGGPNITTYIIEGLRAGTTYTVRVLTVYTTGGLSAYDTGPGTQKTTFAVPTQVSPPTVNETVTSGILALTVSWNKPQSDRAVTMYKLQYRKTSDGGWMSENVVSRNHTLPNVDAGIEYWFRVRAVSDVGNGVLSEEIKQITSTVPSEVTGVRLSVVSGQTALRVDWAKPTSGRPIIRYKVEYGVFSNSWIDIVTVEGADSLTARITNLQRTTTYVVRVRAVSDLGKGDYNPTPYPNLLLPNLPLQVTRVNLAVVAGQETIKVTWSKPTVDGTFTRYDVQYKTSSKSWDDSSTKAVVDRNVVTVDLTNLQRGTTYNVRVRAASNAGDGSYSPPNSTTIPRFPSKVTGVSASVISGQTIRVNWDKTSSDRPIIKYEVNYGVSGTRLSSTNLKIVQGADSMTTTIAGLVRGTTYTVRVRAVSDAGNGPYSTDPLPRITVPKLPLQVTGVSLSVVSGKAALRVTWTMASLDGTFIRYDVQYKTSSQSWDASTTETVEDQNVVTVDLINLPRQTTYTVRVRAVSNVGNGDYSAEATYTLPRLPLQVPRVNLAVVAGQKTVKVTWSQPTVDGAFTRYDVQYKTRSQTWDASTTKTVTVEDHNVVTVDLTNLQRGTTYNVRVRAVSNAGNGPYSRSNAAAAQYLPKLPPLVTGVKLMISDKTAVTVTWTMPSVQGDFIRYDVQYRTSSQSWDDSTTQTVEEENVVTAHLLGLQQGTAYTVRVRVVSNAGNGDYSTDTTKGIPNVPGMVSEVQVNTEKKPAHIEITVYWTPPDTEKRITHYVVGYREAGSMRSLNTTNTSAVIIGTSGRTYVVRVRAVSAAGPGPWSKIVKIAPPSAPTGVAATSINTTSVTVTWKDDGFKYRIFVNGKSSSERSSQDPVSPPHTITELDSNTGYTITVEAYNTLGSTGTNISVSTMPDAPPSLNLNVVSSTVIRVTWTAPPNADRLPLTYLISYQSEFDSGMKEASTQTVELTGLHPFAEYTVSVQTRNTVGQHSVILTSKSTTLSAAPSEPPQSVQFRDRLTAHDSLTISWRIPPKNNRNGIITSYLIRLRRDSDGNNGVVGNFMKVVDNPSFEAPKNITYTVTSLFANIQYGIRVAAVTSGGTGVFSLLQKKKTALDLYVSMLTDEVNSDTSSTISWAAPEGVVISYPVYYGVYQSGTFKMRTTTTPSIQLDNLTPETPIEVLVKPVIAQGTGGSVSKIIFSKEGVPTVPVKNVTVMRINRVSLRVSWTPLSLHEARGMPVYTVIVQSTAGRTTRATVTSNTTNSTIDVDGLIPCTIYSVMVQVGTSAGTSADLLSDPVTAGPYCTDTTAIIVAVLVVIIMLVIAIIITVVVILFLYRARKKAAKSFSPSQSESEVEIKGGKGNSVQMMALASNSEKQGSMGELHNPAQNGNLEPVVTYETVTTSMGAPVDKSDFASHVTMMHKSRDSGFEKEYLSIVNDPEGVEAIAKANKLKNRYINIHTFDHSRVMLNVPDDNGSDYINASYIDGYKRENAYIASQGPTPSTISDFWQMIVDHKAPVIVMLTKVEEKGKKKCEQYWDETLNTKVDKGRGIQVTTVKFTPYADYEVREFQITSSSSPSVQPLKVKHFLYTAWPDHGVPQHPSSLVRFTHKVRRAYQNSAAPIIVHCSAGVGRTGTYLTIDAMMQRIREVADLNIYEFVVEMRSKRTFMVQNQDQYAFIHDALCDYITCGDTSIAAHELRRVIIEMEATDPKTKKSGFDQQFEFLGSLSKVPFGEDFKFSKKLSISKKNRFKDRFPYSNSHLHVPGKSPSNGSDYINASYVNSYSRKNAFIAAQTPLPSTVADFWELLWQFKPPTVVILTSADDDKDGADFWPTQEEGVADYGVVKVNHKATMPCSDYDRHTLEVVDKRKDKCTPHTLKLFHFTTWSADSAPHLSSLLDMMGEVEKNHVGSTKSITVACSDGMSRTGVFVSVMNEIERLKTENEVDLFQTIKLARSKRPYFVFTPEQYKLCFDILQAYLDSFDTYANFKVV